MFTSRRRFCNLTVWAFHSAHTSAFSRYLAHQKGALLCCLSWHLEYRAPDSQPADHALFHRRSISGQICESAAGAAIGFLVAALVQQALAVGATYQGEYVAWTATNALREDLTAHSLSLDMQVHNDKSPGEFIERIETDATNFSNFFSQLVVRIAGNLLLLVGIVIALIVINPLLGAAFFAFIALALAVLALVRGIAVPHQKAQREAETELFAFLEERLAGTEDIRSCGAVNFVINRLLAARNNTPKVVESLADGARHRCCRRHDDGGGVWLSVSVRILPVPERADHSRNGLSGSSLHESPITSCARADAPGREPAKHRCHCRANG